MVVTDLCSLLIAVGTKILFSAVIYGLDKAFTSWGFMTFQMWWFPLKIMEMLFVETVSVWLIVIIAIDR